MRNYIIKRVLLFIPTILGVSVFVFGALRVLPGDVAELILTGGDPDVVISEDMKEELRKKTGLDKPIHIQYIDWIWGVARFDLGNSWNTDRPITRNLKRQLPVTLQLAVASLTLVVLIALPIGILAALYQDRWPDYLLRGTAVLTSAMPGFFAAIPDSADPCCRVRLAASSQVLQPLGKAVGFHDSAVFPRGCPGIAGNCNAAANDKGPDAGGTT